MDVTNFGEKPDELLKGTTCNELAPYSQREAILDVTSMSRTSGYVLHTIRVKNLLCITFNLTINKKLN